MKKLLLLFACAFLAGSVTARSDVSEPACTIHGTDLTAELKQRDPAAWDQIRREAEAVPNHKGIIWKIEKDGIAPSYLFGTIHLSDPRVMKLPQAAAEAYRSTATVIIESTDILDPKALLRIKLEQPELMLFTDGTGLQSHLPQDRIREIEDKLAKRGVILGAVDTMKPWIVTSLLALPKCERDRKMQGESFLDERLAEDAAEEGRAVKGLESAAEQLEAMSRLPLDFHIRNLVATVDYGDRIEDAMETTTALYLQGETGMIMPAIRKIAPDDLPDADYDLFQQVLITERNHIMAERAAPLLEKGDVFIAVGAMHLPGRKGLVELLRAEGYRVTPL